MCWIVSGNTNNLHLDLATTKLIDGITGRRLIYTFHQPMRGPEKIK